jgi:hypothetical protein
MNTKHRWTLKPLAKSTPKRGRFGIFRNGQHVGIASHEDGRTTFKQAAGCNMTEDGFRAACNALWNRDGEHAMGMVRAAANRKEAAAKAPAPAAPAKMTMAEAAAAYDATDLTAATEAARVEVIERPLTAREIQCLKFAFAQGGDGCHVRAFEVRGFGDKLLAMLVGKGFFEMREDPPRLKLTLRGNNAVAEHTPLGQ